MLALLTTAGCKTGSSLSKDSPKQTSAFSRSVSASAPAIVYKTRKDYSKQVFITLSADKKSVTSYPAPRDITAVSHPTPLKNGYYLDNRGIGPNVAYLNITLEEYAALAKAPSEAELLKMVIDDNPLTELCDCGSRYSLKNPEEKLNKIISFGKLKKECKVIK